MKAILSLAFVTGSLVMLSAGQPLAGAPVVVPDPSSMALIAGAAAAVAWAKFRKRR